MYSYGCVYFRVLRSETELRYCWFVVVGSYGSGKAWVRLQSLQFYICVRCCERTAYLIHSLTRSLSLLQLGILLVFALITVQMRQAPPW
jgi:hypothetical protein